MSTSLKNVFYPAAIAFVLVLMLGTTAALAGDNGWTYSGLVGSVADIVTDPVNPDIIYVLMNNGDAGQPEPQPDSIMKSTDGGSTWVEIGGGWGDIYQIAIAHDSSNILYAATAAGLYLTQDGGLSWRLVYADFETFAVAVSPADWKETYLSLCYTGGPPCSGSMHTDKLLKTTDGGASWSVIGAGLPGTATWDRLWIAPSAPHVLLIRASGSSMGPYDYYKSTDGGLNWVLFKVPVPNTRYLPSMAFDPLNSNTIYLGTCSPISWKSTDGGATWQPLSVLPQACGEFVIDPSNTQVIHAIGAVGSIATPLESLDGGATWTPIDEGLAGAEMYQMAIGSRRPLKLFGGVGSAGAWAYTQTDVQDYSLTINDAALFADQLPVILTLTAPPRTTEMQISNDGGFGGAVWEKFAQTKPWTLASAGKYEVPRTVYVKFKTKGQITSVYQDDIVLDTKPPSGSVAIANGIGQAHVQRAMPPAATEPVTPTLLLPAIFSNCVPGYRLVELILTAEDDLSGLEGMYVSNSSSFSGALLQAYTSRLTWLAPDNNEATVYVKFQDRAGNVSAAYTAKATAP